MAAAVERHTGGLLNLKRIVRLSLTVEIRHNGAWIDFEDVAAGTCTDCATDFHSQQFFDLVARGVPAPLDRQVASITDEYVIKGVSRVLFCPSSRSNMTHYQVRVGRQSSTIIPPKGGIRGTQCQPKGSSGSKDLNPKSTRLTCAHKQLPRPLVLRGK